MRWRDVVWLSAALTAFACGSDAAGTVPSAASSGGTAPAGTLSPGDTLEINVYGQEDLSGKYQITEEGLISFPLIDPILVTDKTAAQVAEALQQALKERHILRDPHVSILVSERASQVISVVGAVAQPGSFPVTSGMTVVQAISLAGGFEPLASQNGTILTRRVDGKLMRYKIPVGKVTEGRAEDIQVKAGDIIYVPERIF